MAKFLIFFHIKKKFGDIFSMKVLVTGGAGYIGSHTCVELLDRNHDVIVFDNFSNSSKTVIDRIKMITGKTIKFIEGDITNYDKLSEVMSNFNPDAVIHFAGVKSVAESINDPLTYYEINVLGLLNTIRAMEFSNCRYIVFSSSATVYGSSESVPFSEDSSLNPETPYGITKMIGEKLLKDWCFSRVDAQAICLRYFNPVGAHSSGCIGEDPLTTPNNLMPFICQVASGMRSKLSIYGNDYLTRDGTGERDYVHVMDLAEAHVKTLEHISELEKFQLLNLGTGRGTTVLELIQAFEEASGQKVPFKIVGRRAGDVAKSWATTSLIKSKLNFECNRSVFDMCKDAWQWQSKNPSGYK